MKHLLRNSASPLTVARSLAALAAATGLTIGSAMAQSAAPVCGPLENHFGPFDYHTQKQKLALVEQFHFTPQVESLVGGKSSAAVAGDLNYTLKAFPNHHRALMSMMRLGEKLKVSQPDGADYPVECYFERALRFRPQDSTVRMIYATYLFKGQRALEAQRELELAALAAGDNALTHYNIGTIYFENQHYEQALAHAHKAYALGLTQPTLRDQLKLRGKWQDPAPAPSAPATKTD